MPERRVSKAVITAAGLGTRFLPITKAQPKEMLPLVDKPTIQYSVEEAIASGIDEIILVTGGGKRAIMDHFDRSRELEYYLEQRGKKDLLAILGEVDQLSDRINLVYVQQKEPLGLGHAVYQAEKLVRGEACAVLLPDDVILGREPCVAQLIEAHLKTGATAVAARRVPRSAVTRYGVFATGGRDGNVHEVLDVVEKPRVEDAPSDLVILGRYVLAPEVFEALGRTQAGAGQEIQLTDAIRSTIGGPGVVAVEFEGDYYDTGTIPGYLKANLALALKRDDLREEMLGVIRDLVDAREMV